ncbi:MAG TPA: LysR family transcriptional regulator [Polyangiales bacterium]|nr:LysR family transcriptional regulator [Polyangiales bacterium]
MSAPDLNLLAALDVLLAEGSVVRAAKRLQLSASAMSRTLTRLRETTGDPLLVRAGRGLVPSPRAVELRERVARLVQDAHAVLRPAEAIDLQRLARTFTFRTSEGFVETFGPGILERVSAQAPRVRLRFVQKPQKDSHPLREGSVDLESGVVDKTTGPELRSAALFRDRLVGVVRAGHPLSKGPVTATRYASGKHISVSRGTPGTDPIDEALAQLGLEREVVAFLEAGFAGALALARASQLIVAVPEHHTATLRTGMHSFALPFTMPEFTVSLLWHPRLDADVAHRWLRTCVREVCAARIASSDAAAASSRSRRTKRR